MDIIAAVQGLSDRELIARGASDIAARDLLRLCDTYFGRCGFAAKQRAARQTRHSLDVLLLIEKYALPGPYAPNCVPFAAAPPPWKSVPALWYANCDRAARPKREYELPAAPAARGH